MRQTLTATEISMCCLPPSTTIGSCGTRTSCLTEGFWPAVRSCSGSRLHLLPQTPSRIAWPGRSCDFRLARWCKVLVTQQTSCAAAGSSKPLSATIRDHVHARSGASGGCLQERIQKNMTKPLMYAEKAYYGVRRKDREETFVGAATFPVTKLRGQRSRHSVRERF